MNKRHDPVLAGKRFGRLRVIRPLPRKANQPHRWQCQCDCGTIISVRGDCLRYDFTKSCGCLKVDVGIKNGRATLKHGDTRGVPEYRAWANMKDRCLNANSAQFKNYGGRGIKVCRRWLQYENFIADMGRKPTTKHSLGRINNDKGYSRSNCRWDTWEQQNNNRRNFDHGAHLRGKKLSKSQRVKISKSIKSIWRRRKLGDLPYPNH